VNTRADIAIIGAGAAGLMAGIWALRSKPGCRVVLVDGARTLGAKILVAGGGRCNVTHHEVNERAFAGSSRNSIRNVLKQFTVKQTVEFFRKLDVELKREETGKLFPVTDKARTVLDALLGEVTRLGGVIEHPFRVDTVHAADKGYIVRGEQGTITADRVVLATGGRSLPKSGSDGHGYKIARSLGHTVTQRVQPALVPLTLPKGHFLCELSGLSTQATLEVRSATGKRLEAFTNSLLCTHFGLSGPVALDISRYYIHARMDDPTSVLVVNWLPPESTDSIDRALVNAGAITVSQFLRDRVPDRLLRALLVEAEVEPNDAAASLPREKRQRLAATLTAMPLPITGDRGFNYAEVTAGGVPLSEVRLQTMESRMTPGLHLVGEILDVDGRIGGFNFQWAWSSGYVAGVSAGRAIDAVL